MYRIVISCSGVPATAGAEAAVDITREFAEHRSRLVLRADNDYDPEGRALMDEFSDCISAYIAEGFDGGLTIESVTKLDP
jgi:hypothetical protein